MSIKNGMRLDLGDGSTVLDLDLEAVSTDAPEADMGGYAKVVTYIDRRKLPLWVLRRSCYACCSDSSTTAAYFRSKLLKRRHAHRGIMASYKHSFCMFYAQQSEPQTFQIRCVILDFSYKQKLDLQLKELAKSTAQEPPDALDHIVARKQRQRLQNRSQISTHSRIADSRRQFTKTSASCILGGLRLRGIPETHPEFQALYKTTLSTVEFAHRHDLHKLQAPMPFESVQDTVETVLRLFTRS
ncbi:LANO_0H23684g1_1 [Lachancea nothofagi CBS 11611]|uniref:Mitochondrial morphogenesis protein SLD7 n=1 Tax=Lachancea nothofagi CBS 11611 TaxID=1266666 RepID=A0A1G4KNZ0_9SACH|nr:LANO_0H23684g1_1 [Lachancea nothofagi CBS 11611]